MVRQAVGGDNAVAVQINGDGNSVTVFSKTEKLELDRPHKRRGKGEPENERQLLLTEWRATTLVGRQSELHSLRTWRDSSAATAVRCMTGRAGSGKSRLGIEACEEAESAGWTAGFVSGDELRRLHDGKTLAQWRPLVDTLIVVDDAAASAVPLKAWLTGLARRGREEEGRLRILLLERHADPDSDYGWWTELRRPESLAQAGASDLLAERPIPLPVIERPVERRELLAEAMRLAAIVLQKPHVEPPAPGSDPDFDRRLADDRLENEPLFLLMAGIVAADRGAPAALALGRIELAKQIALLERARLERLATGWGLPDGELIGHLAACVTLQRGCGSAAALALVAEELEALKRSSPISAEKLVDLLADAFPMIGGDEIDRVRPDLIGEAFVIREILGRRARSEQDRADIVDRGWRRNPAAVLETLILAAQDLASGASDHPAVRWLAEVAGRSENLGQLIDISNRLPLDTLAMRELGAFVSERIVSLMREIPGSIAQQILASALNNLAVRLRSLGRREAALDAAREAAALYGTLAAANPDEFRADHAMAVNNLGIRLADMGQTEEALAACQQAVDLRRQLAAEQPRIFRSKLANSLSNLSNRLSELGRLEEAFESAKEAVELYTIVAAENPTLHTSDLAGALNNLSNRLSDVGHRAEALEVSQRSVDLYRSLAATRPDAFTPALAGSLSNHAIRLNQAEGRKQDALAAIAEAAELFRNLAAARPDAFTPEFAMALNNLAAIRSDNDDAEAALADAEEAAELYRALAAARPDSFTPDVAMSQNNLANRLARLGRYEEALAAAREAVQLYEILAASRPDSFKPRLAIAVSVLSDMLAANGQMNEAVEQGHKAVVTIAPYFMQHPHAFAQMMRTTVRDYIRYTQAAGAEPDVALLESIGERLDSIADA